MVNSLFKEGDDATANSSDPFAKARSELKGMQFMKNAKERRMKEMRDELQALGDDVQNNTSETTIPAKRTSQKKKDTLERIVLQPGRGVDCGKVALDPENTAEEALNHGEPLPQSEFAGSRARGGKISHVKTIKPEAPRPASEEEPLSAPDSAAVEERPYDDELTKSYLVSRAFAQDEVDGEFLLKKNAQVDNVVEPLDRNAALPGWGEWGGENPSLNKRHKEKVAHYTLQKEIEKSFLLKSRADASLDHVVINHDGVELVPDRMTLHMVPRPFSNAQEFARSMRQPVGPEWSSSIGFKEGVQPRVEVQQGQAVVPLDVSNVPRKSKTKRRKT
ncbi:Utp14 protein, putative [Angomonas deanei]|uniref:Utp14 protein, putative n=1 Tax=Angomonas deanei TaxID=59799 RepID=A0A7G2CBI6_9TRYP|nr:Utp14 protein, putative [Angomonas deanei]